METVENEHLHPYLLSVDQIFGRGEIDTSNADIP
jgi:hypothetical protein